MRIILLMILFSCATTQAHAYECKKTEWPYAPSMPTKEMQALLESLPRQYVFEYFIFEATSTKPKVGLLKKLGHFLYYTETVEEYRSMFELMRASSGEQTGEVRPAKMADLCELNRKVEAYRNPGSKKKIKK